MAPVALGARVVHAISEEVRGGGTVRGSHLHFVGWSSGPVICWLAAGKATPHSPHPRGHKPGQLDFLVSGQLQLVQALA